MRFDLLIRNGHLIDPAAGLDATETEWLADRLRSVRDDGVAILLVDHDMSLVLGLCDEIVVLEFGRVLVTGEPERIRVDPAVRAAYLGEDAAGSSGPDVVRSPAVSG